MASWENHLTHLAPALICLTIMLSVSAGALQSSDSSGGSRVTRILDAMLSVIRSVGDFILRVTSSRSRTDSTTTATTTVKFNSTSSVYSSTTIPQGNTTSSIRSQTILCHKDSDCGNATEEYVCINGDLFLKKTLPKCRNFGTPQAQCYLKMPEPILLDVCGRDEECVDGFRECQKT